jgi:hypothetical protein
MLGGILCGNFREGDAGGRNVANVGRRVTEQGKNERPAKADRSQCIAIPRNGT